MLCASCSLCLVHTFFIEMEDELLHLLAIQDLQEAEESVEQHEAAVRVQHLPLNFAVRNPMELTNEQFAKVFRLDKDSFTYLEDLLRPHMTPPIRNGGLDIRNKVGVMIFLNT